MHEHDLSSYIFSLKNIYLKLKLVDLPFCTMMKQIVFAGNIIRLEKRNNMNTENNYISGQTI